ncbi:UNVERIFIED_CONTAM: hypothetical protein OHV15_06430 [Microbacterium sp. SLM126]
MAEYRETMIRQYLKGFDRQARDLPRRQRNRLRSEISAHLREAIPESATEVQVATALEDFGPVNEILEQSDLAPSSAALHRRWVRVLVWLIVGVLAVVGVLIILPLLFVGGPVIP